MRYLLWCIYCISSWHLCCRGLLNALLMKHNENYSQVYLHATGRCCSIHMPHGTLSNIWISFLMDLYQTPSDLQFWCLQSVWVSCVRIKNWKVKEAQSEGVGHEMVSYPLTAHLSHCRTETDLWETSTQKTLEATSFIAALFFSVWITNHL